MCNVYSVICKYAHAIHIFSLERESANFQLKIVNIFNVLLKALIVGKRCNHLGKVFLTSSHSLCLG